MGKGEMNPIVIPRLEDPWVVPAEERDEHLALLEEASQHLEIERTMTLAVSDANNDHELFGYPSSVAYLKDRFRISGGRAHRYVKLARFGQKFKATLLAWKHRLINSDQTESLARAAERLPDRYPEGESVLLEIIGDTPEETKQILDYWTLTAENDQLARTPNSNVVVSTTHARPMAWSRATSPSHNWPAKRSSPH
ncbi:MAG: hypothetical protein U9N56_07020 [Actinomycetota bacterium]|nr:hypothetical protein [Actinomycetota bacterium]